MSRLCIVFDLDDTLYLERDYVFSGFRTLSKWVETNLQLSGFGECANELYRAGAGAETLQRALVELGCQPAAGLISAMLDVYRTHDPDIDLTRDADECLELLTNLAPLSIITDGRPFAQYAKCTRLGLNERVSRIVCTGDWGEAFYKPHHRAFEFIEYNCGNASDTFVYVADNPLKDFHAPLARGWKTIRIRRVDGLHAHRNSAIGSEPHYEFGDLSEIPALITAEAATWEKHRVQIGLSSHT
jgi:putative hydrolase of the HAD superfamily